MYLYVRDVDFGLFLRFWYLILEWFRQCGFFSFYLHTCKLNTLYLMFGFDYKTLIINLRYVLYLHFNSRCHLGSASGFQSLQFRLIENKYGLKEVRNVHKNQPCKDWINHVCYLSFVRGGVIMDHDNFE
jgi:hypothetical protein